MSNKNSKLRILLTFMLVAMLTAGITFGAVYANDVTSGECGNGVVWSFSEDGALTISGEGMMGNYRYDGMPWYHLKDQVTKVVIEEGVTHVGELAFYGFSAIKEISLPESTVSIGRYAFFGCSGISSVTIPESVVSIGQYAFRKTSLKSVTMTSDGWSAGVNELTALDDAAEAAKMLTSHAEGYSLYLLNWKRTVEVEVTVVDGGECGDGVNWTLYSNGLFEVSGEGDMKDYGPYTTPWNEYKNRITRIVIGEGVTSVGYCAFYGCYELVSVELPESLISIDRYAFFDCRALGAVVIPENVDYIGEYAFRKCFSMGTVTLSKLNGWSIGKDELDGSALADGSYVFSLLSNLDYKRVWSRVCIHEYEEYIEVKPTTFGEGKAVYTCSDCGDAYDAVLPATKSLKLLAIGNSFSQDAFEHLYIVCKNAGIEELVLGNLYIGGCSLETHYNRMTNDTAAYVFYLSNDEKMKMVDYGSGTKMTAKFGIEYTDWDYITLQQNSANSGLPDSYDWLDDVINYVDQYKPEDAQYFWHMTWAYQGNSTHNSFPTYDKDQMKMYNAILSCVNDRILTNSAIKGVVPSGTAIQNLRTSHLGDTLTRDGHHLSNGIGRYAAALTYLAAITGYDISSITATPSAYSEVATHLPCIKEAVKNAIAKPYEVTHSTDYPYVAPEEPEEPEYSDEILGTTLSPLTDEDRAYLTSKGYDPDRFMLLDLTVTANAYYDSRNDISGEMTVPTSGSTYKKFLGTQVFTRNELVVGSLIRVDAGYKYRPEGWAEGVKNTSSNRPAVYLSAYSELVTVTVEWWGSFDYRGFNICKGTTSANEDITLAEKDNFKIYIPVATKSELTAEDRAYLEGLGLNPNNYMALDYTYKMHSYYNASQKSAISTGNTALHKEFLATNEKFTRYDIPVGSVIRINTTYRYRPEAWITLDEKVASGDRPARVTTATTVVDAAWWADWGYRAFNVQTKSSGTVMTEAGANALRIYVPVDRTYIELTDEDRAYLESLGLDPDEYKVLNFDYTVGGFYDASSHGSSLNTNHSTLSKRFIGTEILTKETLVNGSIIRITKDGYRYRPEGWVALDQKVASGSRPGNVTAQTTVVDDAWWGSWNFRGFNISAADNHSLTAEEVSVLRIYVPVSNTSEE